MMQNDFIDIWSVKRDDRFKDCAGKRLQTYSELHLKLEGITLRHNGTCAQKSVHALFSNDVFRDCIEVNKRTPAGSLTLAFSL